MKRHLAALCTALSLALCASTAFGQAALTPVVKKSPVDNPQHVLFVGSSIMYWLPPHGQPDGSSTPGELARRLEEMTLSVGNEVGAFIIPVGLAFQEAYRQRPGIKLQMGYDDYHPTFAGQYLASSVVYASLYDRSPVGNPYDYFGALDKDTREFVQKVAHDTVRKFYGR